MEVSVFCDMPIYGLLVPEQSSKKTICLFISSAFVLSPCWRDVPGAVGPRPQRTGAGRGGPAVHQIGEFARMMNKRGAISVRKSQLRSPLIKSSLSETCRRCGYLNSQRNARTRNLRATPAARPGVPSGIREIARITLLFFTRMRKDIR